MVNTRAHIKQLVILSGKGGTGKTCVSAALIHLASQSAAGCVFVDADVDAANLGLVLNANRSEIHPFTNSKLAHIDPHRCSNCDACFDVCRYDAINPAKTPGDSYKINQLLCEGCAACVHICPESAIEMITQDDGEWYQSQTPYGQLFHAELFPAAENTGKLVTLVKQHAKLYAEDHHLPLMIVDGPPGIGCPVISASAGADLALLVAEPSISGIHDLKRALKTVQHFNIPAMICINKSGLYVQGENEIRALAKEYDLPIAGEIPFDRSVPAAMLAGEPITRFAPNSAASFALLVVWESIRFRIFQGEQDHV